MTAYRERSFLGGRGGLRDFVVISELLFSLSCSLPVLASVIVRLPGWKRLLIKIFSLPSFKGDLKVVWDVLYVLFTPHRDWRW